MGRDKFVDDVLRACLRRKRPRRPAHAPLRLIPMKKPTIHIAAIGGVTSMRPEGGTSASVKPSAAPCVPALFHRRKAHLCKTFARKGPTPILQLVLSNRALPGEVCLFPEQEAPRTLDRTPSDRSEGAGRWRRVPDCNGDRVWECVNWALLERPRGANRLDLSRAVVDCVAMRAASWGPQTGPNSTDRREKGS